MKIYDYIKKIVKNIVMLDCVITTLRDYKFISYEHYKLIPSKQELDIKSKFYEDILETINEGC